MCGPTESGYLSPPNTDENYLFADGSHPSGDVHAAVASTVISTLTAPVQISLGGEGGVEVARAHRDAVFAERILDLGSRALSRKMAQLPEGTNRQTKILTPCIIWVKRKPKYRCSLWAPTTAPGTDFTWARHLALETTATTSRAQALTALW